MSHTAAPCEYHCPGEHYSISRSVHLARLAAYYPKCGTCSHNRELGAWKPPPIPLPIVHDPGADLIAEQPPLECRDESIASGPIVFTREGVRGIYLNSLSRGTASELTGAFAYCLWELIQSDADSTTTHFGPNAATTLGVRNKRGPTVIVAHDERPSSPDIVMGVAAMLRRMGCSVIDVGLTTRPEFAFAVQHLSGDGGVFVTGAGCDPAWSGVDFAGRDGAPWSLGGSLDRVRDRFVVGVSRPSRRPGTQRLFSVSAAYEAGLFKHWHALRPLQIVCALPGRRTKDLFERLFYKLPCRLIPVPTPVRGRSLDDPDDPDLARTAAAVRSCRAHLGLLVSEAGDACAFIDEQGTLVPSDRILSLFARELCEQRATVTVVTEGKDSSSGHSPRIRCVSALPTREGVWEAWDQHRADLAGGPTGRYWFDAPGAVCDAIITVAHLLQALSRDDTPLSDLIK